MNFFESRSPLFGIKLSAEPMFRFAFPSIVLLATWCAAPALAADVSRWDGDQRSSVRLVAGATERATGQLRAGVEVKLKPGWITYWRYPGDAGIPPRFDFTGSENLRSAEVLWPAPVRIEKGGVESIGYDASVTFPVRIVPADPARPVTLRLKLDYGVCEKLCVPAQALVELPLTGSSHSQDTSLKTAEALVPAQVALGPREGLAVTKVKRDGNRVVVSVAGGVTDLFVEGPTADWALPLPKKDGGTFTFMLDGAPPGAAYDGAEITLTAVAAERAIEVRTRLD